MYFYSKFQRAMKRIHLAGLLLIAFVCTFCGGPTSTVTYTVEDVEFVMEGPLFEGPNSAYLTHDIDFSSVTSDSLPVTADNIKGARLVSATLHADDSMTFDLWSSATLQLTADEADMEEIAVRNPVPEEASTITLKASEEAEVDDFFALSNFIFVVDGSLKEDWYDNFYFTGDFTFELEVRH